jgi:hypothetical protein
MPDIKGSCRCGSVSYVTTADPVFVGVCHCTKCQKSTGSAYGTVIAFPTPSLTVTGTTKQFDDVGDSGQPTHRTFCPNCGSTITQFADVMQGLTMVAYGTLDDPSIAKPTMQIYCDSALPWSKIPEVQGFPKMPG